MQLKSITTLSLCRPQFFYKSTGDTVGAVEMMLSQFHMELSKHDGAVSVMVSSGATLSLLTSTAVYSEDLQ